MHADARKEMTLMNRTKLFAAATLALGLFACDRSADRASQTNTTSAPQPVETSGTISPNVDEAKDGGHATITTTASDTDMSEKDGGHPAGVMRSPR
jgi:hypothetical protein